MLSWEALLGRLLGTLPGMLPNVVVIQGTENSRLFVSPLPKTLERRCLKGAYLLMKLIGKSLTVKRWQWAAA